MNQISMPIKTHAYRRRVAFHETDAMGVVHHSNYIKFFEEGRVHWLREQGMIGVHKPDGPFTFAVVALDCKFLKTVRFEDPIEVWVQGRIAGIKLHFRYAVLNVRTGEWAATGHTDLVPLNDDHKPTRLPPEVRALFFEDSRDRTASGWPGGESGGGAGSPGDAWPPKRP